MNASSKVLIILLGTLICIAPVSGDLSSASYYSEKYGFSIYPPAGWEPDDSSDYVRQVTGAVVLFWGPQEPDTGGTVTVLICTESSSLALNEYVSSGSARARMGIPASAVQSEQMRKINGLSGYEIVATTTGQTSSGTFILKQKAVFFLEKGRVYYVSFMASVKYYEIYLSDFEESLQTFALGPPKSSSATSKAIQQQAPSYFPLAIGNHWTYAISTSGQSGEFDVRIDTKETVGGVECYVREYLLQSGNQRECYAWVGDRLYMYKSEVDYQVFSMVPPVLSLDSPLESGHEWTWQGQGQAGSGTFTVTESFHVMEPMRLSVPAGTFDTVVVQVTHTDGGYATGTRWYACGVGLVKDVSTTQGVTVTLELKSFKVLGQQSCSSQTSAAYGMPWSIVILGTLGTLGVATAIVIVVRKKRGETHLRGKVEDEYTNPSDGIVDRDWYMKHIEQTVIRPRPVRRSGRSRQVCTKHDWTMAYDYSTRKYFCAKCRSEGAEADATHDSGSRLESDLSETPYEQWKREYLERERKRLADGPARNAVAAPSTKFCRYCGAKIPRQSKFCEECGKKLVE